MDANEQNLPYSIFTCGFKGFENDSLWFTPFCTDRLPVGEELFAQAMEAKTRAQAILKAGCLMAEKRHPELNAELGLLAVAEFDLDFFDFQAPTPATGWFRLTANAPRSSRAAIEACERALEKARAPLMSAKVDGELALFGSGGTDTPQSTFIEAALEATLRVARAFDNERFPGLSGADLIELMSLSGERIVACVPAPKGPIDARGEVKAYAQIAQACVGARQALASNPMAGDFFTALQNKLLGSGGTPLPKWTAVNTDQGAFFALPKHIRALSLRGLPDAQFAECAQAFLGALSLRAGTLAASRSAPSSPFEHATASIAELCEMQGLFSKLPAHSPVFAPEPTPSKPAAQ